MHWLSQSHAHSKKAIIANTRAHTNLPFSIQMEGFWRLFIQPFPLTRIYRLHLLPIYIYISLLQSDAFTTYSRLSFSMWKNFLFTHILICFFSHTPKPDTIIHSTPKTYLMAFCFIFDPWCCHVKPCICFVDVMTIASTILMMWWDWPNARQRSGTDEKTWLSDFLFSRSSVSACAPSCRVLYHYWQLWNIQQQVFISRFIFRRLFICTAVPLLKKMSKTDSLHHLWIFTGLLVRALWLPVIMQIHCMDFCWITCLSHVAWVCVYDCFYI